MCAMVSIDVKMRIDSQAAQRKWNLIQGIPVRKPANVSWVR